MPRKFSEKYIATLSDTSLLEELGREGFERKTFISLGFKSPRMIFIRSNAFYDQIASLGFDKNIKKGLNFEDKQELKDGLLNRALLPEIHDELESEYNLWKMDEKHPLVEIRLSNKDNDLQYMEKIVPIVIKNFEDFTKAIRKTWADAVEAMQSDAIVQVTEIPVYDSTGFVYVNVESRSIEINSVYGLWLGDNIESFDVCFASYDNLEVEKYVLGTQQFMSVKSGGAVQNVNVSDEWIKSYKLSQSQIKKLLKASKDLSVKLNRSIEFSFGVHKNVFYIHDLKNLKTDFYKDEYDFSENFFFDQDSNGFKNDVEAIANLELPFFLREDMSSIEKNVESGSQKDLIVNRLKKTLKGNPFKNSTYKKLNTPNQIYQEDKFDGFLIEFESFLKSVNNLDKASPEAIYNALKQNVSTAQKYFENLQSFEKEIILKLSNLSSNLSDRRFETSYLAKTLEIMPLRRVGLEIVMFKGILETSNLNDISLSLPALRTFEELEFVLSILDLSELNIIKENKSKLYVDLSIPSMLFEYSRENMPKKYLMDGIVIDLHTFMKSFLDKKVFTERDYGVASAYLETNIDSLKNKTEKVILISRGENDSELISNLNPSVLVLDR